MKKLLLNTLILVLTVALIAVAVLNAVTTSGLFTASEEIYEHTNDGDSLSENAFRFLLPEFIGAKGAQLNALGFYANSEATAEVYSFLSPLICAAFTSGNGEYIENAEWLSLIGESNVIYLRYHAAYTAAMIAAHLGCTLPVKGENPEVAEILLTVSDTGAENAGYTLYTRDLSGRVCAFTAERGYKLNGDTVLLDKEAFSRFADLSGSSEFDFVLFSNISGIPEKSLLTPSQPILSTPPAPGGLRFESSFGEPSSELLATLGFTPAGLGSYTDDTGARVYVNTLGTLRYREGNMEFEAAFDGGIVLEGTNGKDGAYSVFESIYAVEDLLAHLNGIRPDLFGNDASLMLTRAETDGSSLTLRFGYYYSNVMILDGNGNAFGITVTVKDGSIRSIDADLINARDISYRIKNYPMFTVLRVLTPSVSPKTYSALRLAYRAGEGDVYTEWMLETE